MNEALGLVLAVLAAAAFGAGRALQKRRAVALPGPASPGRAWVLAFLADPRWLAATGVVLAGWAFEIAALAYASTALVFPVGLAGIALVATLSARWFGERLRAREWTGVALCVAGLVAAGLSTGGDTGAAEALRWAPLSAAVGALVLVGGACAAFGRRAPRAELPFACAAGFLYAASGLSTKALAVAVKGDHGLLAAAGAVAAIGTIGAAALFALQAAFQRGRATVAVAVSDSLSNMIPAALGAPVFGEAWPEGGAGAMRIAALGALAAGFALLLRPAARRESPSRPNRGA